MKNATDNANNFSPIILYRLCFLFFFLIYFFLCFCLFCDSLIEWEGDQVLSLLICSGDLKIIRRCKELFNDFFFLDLAFLD